MFFRSDGADFASHPFPLGRTGRVCFVRFDFGARAYYVAFMDRWNILGPWISLFDIGILILTFGLFFYCRVMTRRGVLK